MAEWMSVGPEEGRAELDVVVIEDLEIALAKLDSGEWVAFDNSCTHEDCPLSDGTLDGEEIICYCHSATFDVRTGQVVEGPAEDPINVYPVRVLDGELQVGVQW
jgi:3-phenylpropionate/trans-cinnamate dioxygenase ferredoxin component